MGRDDHDSDPRGTGVGRRDAAVARFLATAVDTAINRRELMAALAHEVATTIGDFCLIMEPGDDGGIRVAAVAGGPGDTAARIQASHVGRSIPVPDDVVLAPGRTSMFDDRWGFFPVMTPELHPLFAGTLTALGLPRELALTATSTISAPVVSSGIAVGRILIERFPPTPAYTDEDLTTVKAISAATSLVLERRAVEERLAASLALNEALFEQAPVPMAYAGADGQVRRNAAGLALFGRSAEEMDDVAGLADAPFIPPDGADAWAAVRSRFAAGEQRIGARLALLRPSGERREVSLSSIVFSVDGKPGGTINVFTDLTDLLSLETQLRHAQKMEALGRLAGGIAHDFNNVLMAILGFAEFAVEDAREGRVPLHDAEQVVAATRRAIELTARLTAFSRREPPQTATVDPARTIESMLPLLRRLAPESIELVTDLEPGGNVVIDQVDLEQIVVNLVVNASDSMPRGGRIVIESRTRHLDADHAAAHLAERPGVHAVISISDTGTGMDDTVRARIFEPFYTTKEVDRGTGLGLATVFAAVERANGRITVYSELGKGSTFTVYLPTVDEPNDDVAARPEPAATGGTESILVVEDDAFVREVVSKALEARGYDVTDLADPRDAVTVARTRRFDLLVTDVVMPLMMGDAVAAAVRAIQPEICVIFLSGYTARALDFTLGEFDTLVRKPVSSIELSVAVRAALDRQPNRDAAG